MAELPDFGNGKRPSGQRWRQIPDSQLPETVGRLAKIPITPKACGAFMKREKKRKHLGPIWVQILPNTIQNRTTDAKPGSVTV